MTTIRNFFCFAFTRFSNYYILFFFETIYNKQCIIIFFFSFLLIFKPLDANSQTKMNLLEKTIYQETVDKIENLTKYLEPEKNGTYKIKNLIEMKTEFDVNQYFKVLDNIFLQPNYILDYVYCKYYRSGKPFIYIRKKSENHYDECTACSIWWSLVGSWEEVDKEEYTDFSEILRKRYLRHIRTDNTQKGFFQLAILYIIGDQFFLLDHAKLDIIAIICNNNKLTEIVQKDVFNKNKKTDWLKQTIKINFKPFIEILEDRVIVEMYIFSKNRGLYKKKIVFQKSFPHIIIENKDKIILKPIGDIH